MPKIVSDQGPAFVGDERRANNRIRLASSIGKEDIDRYTEIKKAVESVADALAAVASARDNMVDDSQYIARRLMELYGEKR